MATGVQSGFRTTAGSQPVNQGSGASAKIPFYKALEKLVSGFTAKQKIIAVTTLLLLTFAIVSVLFYQKSTAYVPLYPDKLSPVDAGKISFELDRMGIVYTLADNGSIIMLPPSCRTRVRAHMAQLHLPQRILRKSEGEGLMLRTAGEMQYNRQLALQTELSESIRSLEGVADAYVTIARPERDYFNQDKIVTTASVIVSTNPGIRLAPAQVKGIMKLVASSVPELDEKNITVVDQCGITISPTDEGGSPGSIELTGKEQEKKISYEQYLQRKVQGILDKAFGPDKAIVVIDTTIDTSSKRTERYAVGDPSTKGSVVTKRKSREENFSLTQKDGDTGTQMSFKGSDGKGQAYRNGETTEIMDVSRTKTETVKPAGDISRITASVLVDNLSPAQVDKVREIVKGAIGYDDQMRNDAVTVASVPFTSNVVQDLQRQRIQGPGTGRQGQWAILTPLHLLALNVVMLSLLVPLAVYAVRRRETAGRRSGLFLAASQAATSCDIADLNTEKHGRGRESENTRINTSEKFAQFATERPSEVAGLLKSTWLAEKKR